MDGRGTATAAETETGREGAPEIGGEGGGKNM